MSTTTPTARDELHKAIGTLLLDELKPDSPFRDVLRSSDEKTAQALATGIGAVFLDQRVGTKDPAYYLAFDHRMAQAAWDKKVSSGAMGEYLTAIDAQFVDPSRLAAAPSGREELKLQVRAPAAVVPDVYG